jgi:hypothetical protein
VYNFAIGRFDLPDFDLIYQLVKAAWRTSRVFESSSGCKRVRCKTLTNTFPPFHPGAVRYYREVGSVPGVARPHELICPSGNDFVAGAVIARCMQCAP